MLRFKKFFVLRAPEGDGGNAGGGGGGAGDPLFGEQPGDAGAGAGGAGAAGGSAGTGGAAPAAGAAAGTPPAITFPDNWKDALPDDIKNAPYMANVKDVQTMAQNYANVQKLIGADKIVVPNKYTSPEQWNEIYDKLGRGKKEEYKVDLEKDAEINPEFAKDFTAKLYDAGVLPHQAKQIMAAISESNKGFVASQKAETETRIQAGLTGLKTEWGAAYDEHMARARAFMKEFATPDEMKALQSNGFGMDPNFIKLVAKAGALLSEDQIKGQGGKGSSFMDPTAAREKIAEIQSNVRHPYFNKEDSGHAAAQKEMKELFAQAYPEVAK